MHVIDPRTQHTIPISASRTVPHTPRSLDPHRVRREVEADIEREERLLAEERRETEIPSEEQYADWMVRQTHLGIRRKQMHEAFEQQSEKVGTPPVFMLRVPTPVERDQINSRLVAMGLVAVSQEQVRASMIEALYETDWQKGDAIANEAHAEELAIFMDGLWQREDVHNRAIAQWQEQEVERVLDEFAGAPARPRAELPPRIITPRESAKAVLLIDQMQQTPRMRKIAARQWDYQRINAMILVRISLVAVRGLDVSPPIAVDPADNALPEADVTALRDAMEARFGPELASLAYEELTQHIDRSYTLDGFEEKNSVSPLEKPNDQNGSIGPSGGSEPNGGNSTGSSSSPAPDGASGTITERSSVSIIGSEGGMATERYSPTGAA